METRRRMFIARITTSTVKLTRDVGSTPGSPGLELHNMTLRTGDAAVASADTSFYQTGCVMYELILRRLG